MKYSKKKTKYNTEIITKETIDGRVIGKAIDTIEPHTKCCKLQLSWGNAFSPSSASSVNQLCANLACGQKTWQANQ